MNSLLNLSVQDLFIGTLYFIHRLLISFAERLVPKRLNLRSSSPMLYPRYTDITNNAFINNNTNISMSIVMYTFLYPRVLRIIIDKKILQKTLRFLQNPYKLNILRNQLIL